MIILDTNVVSELMRGSASHPQVARWIRLLTEKPTTTVINRAELISGVTRLPDGAGKSALGHALTLALEGLGPSVAMTDSAAARYGDVIAARRRLGRPIDKMDALISAICLDADATLATRNVDDFSGLGLKLVNPWAE